MANIRNTHRFNPFNPIHYLLIFCLDLLCCPSYSRVTSKSVTFHVLWRQRKLLQTNNPSLVFPAAPERSSSLHPRCLQLLCFRLLIGWAGSDVGVVCTWDLAPVCSASSERWRFSPSHTPTVTHARIYSASDKSRRWVNPNLYLHLTWRERRCLPVCPRAAPSSCQINDGIQIHGVCVGVASRRGGRGPGRGLWWRLGAIASGVF